MRVIPENQWTITFYALHNASIVVAKGSNILEVIELERFISYKNASYFNLGLTDKNIGTFNWKNPYLDEEKFVIQSKLLRDYICEKYTDKFDVGIVQGFKEVGEYFPFFYNYPIMRYILEFNEVGRFKSIFKADRWINTSKHHRSHISNSFYQSPYTKALCISADGLGNDGAFNFYLCEKGKDPIFLEEVEYSLGGAYQHFAHFLSSIKTDIYGKTIEPYLEYSGKIMGLSSYGKVRQEWLPHFKKFYLKKINKAHEETHLLDSGIKLIKNSGQDEYDIAATSQKAFEEVFLEISKPHMDRYPNLPICFSGGCALNIILNTKLVEEFSRELFIGPTPNDSGQALGMMLDYLRPSVSVDSTYLGIPILDINSLNGGSPLDITELALELSNGKIYGIMRGRSETGPRALGNRSILCNPAIQNMKDVLNSKVKNRESFRPFAPVVRLQDVNKYFHWNRESRWMSFCPKVREEYKSKLPSITHVDGTARVQTVTREQNQFLYDLLTEMEKITNMGVLLNTSFNIAGKPMLSTVKEAIWMLENTGLDGLVIENTKISKT